MLSLGLVLLSSNVHASFDPITGYAPNTDVVQHSRIDLDQAAMETALAANDFERAYAWYKGGGNSLKSPGTVNEKARTIKGFSTDAGAKMNGRRWFELYKNYWGRPDYADAFTTAGCNGTDQFATADPAGRREFCKKGSAYQNVWMYVIWEMTDAVEDCQRRQLDANGDAAHAWDEAVAFYSGSLEGATGAGSGKLLYALAEKRCANFGTCNTDGSAPINDAIIQLFKEGQDALIAGKCQAVVDIRDRIVAKMTVPLVQGTIRYAYRSDPNGLNRGTKDRAEGWAFAAAILPQVQACSQRAGDEVRENMFWNATTAVVDGAAYVKKQLEDVYVCMGITCEEVGGLRNNADTDYITGLEPCVTSSRGSDSDDELDEGGIAGVVIAIVVVVLLFGAALYFCGRSNGRKYAIMEKKGTDLGTESVVTAEQKGSAV
ncbi:hypothetical protein AAMO2058_001457100 [Amorphochlora amoebiformis]